MYLGAEDTRSSAGVCAVGADDTVRIVGVVS